MRKYFVSLKITCIHWCYLNTIKHDLFEKLEPPCRYLIRGNLIRKLNFLQLPPHQRQHPRQASCSAESIGSMFDLYRNFVIDIVLWPPLLRQWKSVELVKDRRSEKRFCVKVRWEGQKIIMSNFSISVIQYILIIFTIKIVNNKLVFGYFLLNFIYLNIY